MVEGECLARVRKREISYLCAAPAWDEVGEEAALFPTKVSKTDCYKRLIHNPYLSTVPNMTGQYPFLPLSPAFLLSTAPVLIDVRQLLFSRAKRKVWLSGWKCRANCVFFITELNTTLHFLKKATKN